MNCLIFFFNSLFKFLSCLNFFCLFTDPSRQRRKRSVSQRPHISTIKEFKEAEEDTDPHKDRLLLVGTQATIMIFITKHYCKLKLSKIYWPGDQTHNVGSCIARPRHARVFCTVCLKIKCVEITAGIIICEPEKLVEETILY